MGYAVRTACGETEVGVLGPMAKWVADRSTRPARRLRGEALPVRGVK